MIIINFSRVGTPKKSIRSFFCPKFASMVYPKVFPKPPAKSVSLVPRRKIPKVYPKVAPKVASKVAPKFASKVSP